MGSAKAQYDGIKAFSETDFTEDLKIIDVPTLVMHGDDDQIVPIADSALLSAKLLKKATLKVYEKFPHGMCTTHADAVNPDLLAFVETHGQSRSRIRHGLLAPSTVRSSGTQSLPKILGLRFREDARLCGGSFY